MLANAAGIMSGKTRSVADQRFFERGFDDVDVVVRCRRSREQQRSRDL